jgi:hypothetical protein
MSELFLVVSSLGFGIGLAIIFVAGMFGLMTVLGHSKEWGVALFLIPLLVIIVTDTIDNWSAGIMSLVVPIASLAYCFAYRDQQGKYPFRLFLAGLLTLVVSSPAIYFSWTAYQA